MKKIFTFFLLLALSLSFVGQLQAQTPRKAMVELATQASCPPCASNNPITLSVVNANAETTILMSYQVWWPGYDPMYLDNPSEVADRINYYGINGAPTTVTQGAPGGLSLTQGNINTATSGMSEFALVLNAEFLDGIIHVTGNIEAELAASGDFRLRVALAEDVISIQDAPGGTNGETEYHHVFKRFLGGSGGINLVDDWAIGDTYEIDLSLPVSSTNIYNYDQLEIIAWIQDDNTRYIHQAAKVDHLDVDFSFNNNAVASAATIAEPDVCEGLNTTTPSFTLLNMGSETLTSAEITYSINEVDEQTVNWGGNLEPLEEITIFLNEINFEHIGETSTLNITVVNVNGITDENAEDNVATLAINKATNVAGELRLVLKTDDAGDETYWQIANSQGELIASGGNATVGLTNIGVGSGSAPDDPGAYNNNQFVIENISIPEDDCYTFTITDYYGDGFGLGAGFYRLITDGELFYETNTFDAQQDRFFESDLSVSTHDVEFTNAFTVSPNPVVDRVKVAFTMEAPAVTTVSVINSLGQTVMRQNQGKLAVGAHQLDIDMSELAVGIYLINISAGNVSGTQTVVVN